MNRAGPLNHIDVSVGYPGRSIAFYEAFLTALGWRRAAIPSPEWSGEDPSRATWVWTYEDGSCFDIELRPARARDRDRRYDRYRPGPHHLAFNADCEAAVDRVHRAVLHVGGEVLDAPADYGGRAGYGDYYYAVFFADPDGLKLEACYVPAAKP